MKWIWPFNWYWRIRELERELAAIKAAYLELDHKYHASAFSYSATQAMLISAACSIASSQDPTSQAKEP